MILLTLICSILSAVLSLTLPVGFGKIIDSVSENKEFRNLVILISMMCGLLLMRALLSFAGSLAYGKVNNTVLMNIRCAMFEHMQRLPVRYFSATKEGTIMSRFLNDVNALQTVSTGAILTIVTDTLLFITIVSTLFIHNAGLALVSCLLLGGYIIALKNNKKIKQISLLNQEKMAEVTSTLSESLAGIRTIKIFGAERRQMALYKQGLQEWFANSIRLLMTMSISREVAGFITSIGPILVLGYGAILVNRGMFSLGELVTFYTLLSQLYAPCRRLAQINLSMQTGLVAMKRVFDFLDEEEEQDVTHSLGKSSNHRGKIEFENVTFAYDPNQPVLDRVSFTIEAGQSIGLVGASGVGKSTLVQLLLRFYDPQEGRILLDGEDIKTFSPRELRAGVGVVNQEVFLFNASVMDNIRYGFPEATEEQAKTAAAAAYAHEFIQSFSEGYDTIVGDRGIKMSAGQRQRISIARAILKNPQILILDEATSSLDSESQLTVQCALNEFIVNRTCIVIAHRLSAVSQCDKIYVLKDGKIVESGKHAELIENKSLYWSYYSNESGLVSEGG